MIIVEEKDFHDNFPYYFYNIYKMTKEAEKYEIENPPLHPAFRQYKRDIVCKVYTSKEDVKKIVSALKEWDNEIIEWNSVEDTRIRFTQ